MKNILYILILFISFSFSGNAQTGIFTQNLTNSALLDFPIGTNKGIILPAVEILPALPSNGTFLVDKTDKKVKMYQNDVWVELSGVGNMVTVVPYSGTVDNGKKTIIGESNTNSDGVLVLESKTKAMVLPKISNPHLNVKSPYPGMMCYDINKKALAVYDGSVWNYWK